jgi:hypothetical protein
VVIVATALQLVGCGQSSSDTGSESQPVTVRHVAGTNVDRLTLSAHAARRLGIQTAPVQRQLVGTGAGRKQRKVIPYAAVLYDKNGKTWVYTSPEPLAFVRHRIRVDFIDRGRAVLESGPPAGTLVVTTGAVELLGTEFEVDEE